MEFAKYIFLDVDGVLNCNTTEATAPSGCIGISDKFVKRLKEMVEATGARIVLSSDWRLDKESADYKYLTQKLKYKGGIQIYSHTPDLNWQRRGLEIRDWLVNHKVANYVILDDVCFADFNRELLDHFVQTDDWKGLTDEDIQKAIEILNR